MERCDGDEGRCNRIRDGKGREEEGEKVQSDRRNFEGALWLVSPCGANGGGVTAQGGLCWHSTQPLLGRYLHPTGVSR